MKICTPFLFVFSFLILHLPASAQLPPSMVWEQEDLICKEQEKASFHFQPRGQRTVFADQTDIFYQSIHWEIDPAQYYIKGEITYYFKSKVTQLTALHLDLAKDLVINSIKRRDQSLTYTHSDDQLLTINLAKTLNPGETDTITINYEGLPPSNGFGSFEQGMHGGQPIIWTLSEPYGVRDWWPGKQDLVDKIDSLDIYITTPIGQLAASNGKLIDITTQDDKSVHHWSHRYPIASYLVALGVTNYSAYSHFLPLENGDTIEILNYVYPETMEQTQASTESSLDIMSLYNELFGIYPFAKEKYGHAQFGWGGGMEHQTMSFMGGFSFSLQAHEMAHQWFGDKVTCGSWSEIWLNEGFATYMTGLTYERFSHEELWPQWKVSAINSITSQPGGSVFVDDTSNVNRIFSSRLTYNKGAYLLHMLRWITGDEAFFAACRAYLDNVGTAYDFGSTDELKGYLEQESGKELDGFFADWYYGQGYPSYQLRWSQQTDSLVIWLGQTTSHPSVSFFEMPVPVTVLVNGNPMTLVMNHQSQDQRFSFFIGNGNVNSIAIDPELWIVSKNNTITEITTSTSYPDGQSIFTVFPNPANNFVEIIPSAEAYDITLTNAYGVQWNPALQFGRIDVSGIPSGFYTMQMRNRQQVILAVQPIVIHH